MFTLGLVLEKYEWRKGICLKTIQYANESRTCWSKKEKEKSFNFLFCVGGGGEEAIAKWLSAFSPCSYTLTVHGLFERCS